MPPLLLVSRPRSNLKQSKFVKSPVVPLLPRARAGNRSRRGSVGNAVHVQENPTPPAFSRGTRAAYGNNVAYAGTAYQYRVKDLVRPPSTVGRVCPMPGIKRTNRGAEIHAGGLKSQQWRKTRVVCGLPRRWSRAKESLRQVEYGPGRMGLKPQLIVGVPVMQKTRKKKSKIQHLQEQEKSRSNSRFSARSPTDTLSRVWDVSASSRCRNDEAEEEQEQQAYDNERSLAETPSRTGISQGLFMRCPSYSAQWAAAWDCWKRDDTSVAKNKTLLLLPGNYGFD